MSKRRNKRTRTDPFWARLEALGGGRFKDPATGRIYVDSRDMDDFLNPEAMLEEWEREQAKATPFDEVQGLQETPPDALRLVAAKMELETMYRVARINADRELAKRGAKRNKVRLKILQARQAWKASLGGTLSREEALELERLQLLLDAEARSAQDGPPTRAGGLDDVRKDSAADS